jgi:hypothetical protein
MTNRYKLTEDRFEHKAGTIVFDCYEYDYGLSNDDSRITGIRHISVTLDSDGRYPFFTVPEYQLEKI